MKDCKHCELWKLLLVMVTVAFVVLAWAVYNADATHDPASKRLDFAPVAEYHLGKATTGRLMHAEARLLCPDKFTGISCTWFVDFYAKNPDGTEEVISYATFSRNPETGALGCMLRYKTVDEELLVDRFFVETTCGAETNSAV